MANKIPKGAIGIKFGALWQELVPLEKQLAMQGVRPAKATDAAMWQEDARAIARLAVRGLIGDAAASQMRRKLMKVIGKGVVAIQRRGKKSGTTNTAAAGERGA